MPFEISYSSLLLASGILGFLLGFAWEFFRILRKAIPHHGILVALEDIAFFLIGAIAYWIICFSFSFGRIRWFSFVMLVLGFILYLATVGKLMTRISSLLIRITILFFAFCKNKILRPVISGFIKSVRWGLTPLNFAAKKCKIYFRRLARLFLKKWLYHRSSRGF